MNKMLQLCDRGLSCFTMLAALVALLSHAHAQEPLPPEIVVETAHSDRVVTVAFSPDGTRILSGSGDQTLKVWDVTTGSLVRTFLGHSPHAVTWGAFAPDGRQILSAGWMGGMQLWDASTGKLIRTLENADRYATFSPDGRWIVTQSLSLWDVHNQKLVRRFLRPEKPQQIEKIFFSPDGKYVLTIGFGPGARLWDVDSGQVVRDYITDRPQIWAASFTPDGKRVLLAGFDHIEVMDLVTGQLVRRIAAGSEAISTIQCSRDGRHVLVTGTHARLWDMETDTIARAFEGHRGHTLFKFSPDETTLVSGGEDSSVKLWQRATGKPIRTFGERAGTVKAMSLSSDSALALSGGADQTLRLWDLATGQLVRAFEGHTAAIKAVAFGKSADLLLSGSADHSVKLWNAKSGQLLATFQGHTSAVSTVAFAGELIVAGGADGTVKVWDAKGRLLRSIDTRDQALGVTSMAVSPDGSRVLTGNSESSVDIWQLSTGRRVRSVVKGDGRDPAIIAVGFSPGGDQIFYASSEASIFLQSISSKRGRALQRVPSFDLVTAVLSRDGKYIVAASRDHTFYLLDVATGQLTRTFRGHSGAINAVAMSSGGKRILTAGDDASIRIWDVQSGAVMAALYGASNGWLTITPQGFFSLSAPNAALFSVIRGLEPYNVHQLYQSLFNPDLVREALAGDPSNEVKVAARVVDLEKVINSGPAPAVEIMSPAEGSASNKEVITVAVQVTDKDTGVGRVEWRVNGVTVAVTPPSSIRGPTVRVTRDLALDLGENTIEVVAYNGSNLLASLPARTTIKFTDSAGQSKPNLHILAIGINAYKDGGWEGHDGGFGKLTLAKKDAETFATDMSKAAAGQYGEVKVVAAFDEQATKANLAALIDQVAREIHPRDTFIVFAAAHGYSVDGRYYMIPQDHDGGTNPAALAKHAIDQGMLQDWLANRIKARKAVVFLDTCESGALIAGHIRSRSDTTGEAAIGRLHEATGRPVLTASALGQYAYEDSQDKLKVRHGLFTWALLQGLRHGDSNGNKLIELSELVAYVQDQVPKLAAKLGGVGTTKSALGGATAISDIRQQARFGSRGEDFVLVGRLQ